MHKEYVAFLPTMTTQELVIEIAVAATMEFVDATCRCSETTHELMAHDYEHNTESMVVAADHAACDAFVPEQRSFGVYIAALAAQLGTSHPGHVRVAPAAASIVVPKSQRKAFNKNLDTVLNLTGLKALGPEHKGWFPPNTAYVTYGAAFEIVDSCPGSVPVSALGRHQRRDSHGDEQHRWWDVSETVLELKVEEEKKEQKKKKRRKAVEFKDEQQRVVDAHKLVTRLDKKLAKLDAALSVPGADRHTNKVSEMRKWVSDAGGLGHFTVSSVIELDRLRAERAKYYHEMVHAQFELADAIDQADSTIQLFLRLYAAGAKFPCPLSSKALAKFTSKFENREDVETKGPLYRDLLSTVKACCGAPKKKKKKNKGQRKRDL